MALLTQASLITLIAIIGVTDSQNLNLSEPLNSVEEKDLGYRPWEKNDTSTTWLSLTAMGITSLNSMFQINLPSLRWLVMDDNQIGRIPSGAFKSFPDLTYISLAGNQIQKLETGAFSFLKKLQVLDLDRNPIQENVNKILSSPLSKLQRLYLRNCQLSSLDFPGSLNSLTHLYLSDNSLQIFHAKNYSALTHLFLNNNRLSYVSLAKFESLTYLDLSGNRLDKIMFLSQVSPDDYLNTLNRMWGYYATEHSALYLDYASNLQYLILSFSKITQIASDSFLGTESLMHVDLTRNEISELNAGTFNNLLNLETLLLDSNKITKINYRVFVNLPNLKIISLTNNQISEIDEDSFTKLYSSANEIYLYLDHNEIRTLRSGSFRGMNGLKHIGLSNNKIKTILSQAFVDLPNLGSLVIENQLRDNIRGDSVPKSEIQDLEIGSIDSYAFSNLPNVTSIQIRGNEFTRIESEAFDTLPKLTMLDLSNNSIEYLSPEAFRDLPEIENMYLWGNSLSVIAPGTFPKCLKDLDLAWNNKCPDFSCWHIEELQHLEKLNVVGIVERFEIEDLAMFPKNLSIVIQGV